MRYIAKRFELRDVTDSLDARRIRNEVEMSLRKDRWDTLSRKTRHLKDTIHNMSADIVEYDAKRKAALERLAWNRQEVEKHESAIRELKWNMIQLRLRRTQTLARLERMEGIGKYFNFFTGLDLQSIKDRYTSLNILLRELRGTREQMEDDYWSLHFDLLDFIRRMEIKKLHGAKIMSDLSLEVKSFLRLGRAPSYLVF